jgi:hypothetical protein
MPFSVFNPGMPCSSKTTPRPRSYSISRSTFSVDNTSIALHVRPAATPEESFGAATFACINFS